MGLCKEEGAGGVGETAGNRGSTSHPRVKTGALVLPWLPEGCDPGYLPDPSVKKQGAWNVPEDQSSSVQSVENSAGLVKSSGGLQAAVAMGTSRLPCCQVRRFFSGGAGSFHVASLDF